MIYTRTTACIFVIAFCTAHAQQQFFPVTGKPTVQVSGVSSIAAEPDRARLFMRVSLIDSNVAHAKEMVDARVDTVLGALAQTGIADSRIDASGLRISRVMEPQRYLAESAGRNGGERYEVAREIDVTVMDLTNLNTVLDRSTAAGVTELWNVHLFSSREDSIRLEAMKQAAQKARRKARELVKTLGGSLGPVFMAEYEFGGGAAYPTALESRDADGYDFPIGKIAVVARTNVVYELLR